MYSFEIVTCRGIAKSPRHAFLPADAERGLLAARADAAVLQRQYRRPHALGCAHSQSMCVARRLAQFTGT